MPQLLHIPANASAGSRIAPFRVWARRLAVVVGGLAALVLIAWLAVPPLVRTQVESRLTEALGRTTTVESVAFDPFTLRLALRKVAIDQPGGPAPLFAADEIVADVSSASLVRWTPILDALKLTRPSLSLARGSDGRYSVQDLLDKLLAPREGPVPAFSVNNIEVEDGAIAFDDRVTDRKHRLEKLMLGIPFLSSLEYQAAIHVTPHLAGTFNGSHFALGGTTTPFAASRESTIDIDLDALPLTSYVTYLPARPRVDLAAGTLTTRLQVVFVDGKPEDRRLELRGDARIDGLSLKRRDGTPLIDARSIAVALQRVDVFGRDVRVASLAVEAPAVDCRRTSDGAFELAGPWFESERRGTQAPPAGGAPDAPWSATIEKLTVAHGKVRLDDATTTFRSDLADIAVEARNLSTRKGEKAHVALAFVSADGIATFKGQADVEPLVPAATGSFELTKFSLGLLFPFYKDVLAVDVLKGSLDLSGAFEIPADRNFRITRGTAAISGLALAFPGNRTPFWSFPSIGGTGIDVDVRKRNVRIAEMHSADAVMKIVRERNGAIDVARLMKTTETTGTHKDEGSWTLVLDKLAFERGSIDIEDRAPEPAVKLSFRDLALTATNYSNARGAKAMATAHARIGSRGRLAAGGAIVSNPFSFTGKVDLSGLDLTSVRPYIESQANISLTAGTFAAKGTVSVDVPDGAPVTATWKGDVALTDFAALDRPTASDLLRWKRLVLEGVDFANEPFRLGVGRVAAEDYFARAIVYSDGTLNLTRLLTPGAEPAPPPDARPAPNRASASRERESLPVTIGRIELARGNVNFSDFFVRPNYSANLTDVTGTVTTMSAQQAGDIAFTARVDGTAPVEVSGRIHPFAKDLSLDITAKARDVDLPPLTPYSVKYAGYGIEKGKLTFDVHYRVENRKLAADNRLVLDQLTFNRQRVDSATATKLPVLLAVALLKDVHGVIDIQLPIAGSLEDPKFSVGGLVIQVIVNLITKAVTAPFALLGAAFGHGVELSTIPFGPGSAVPDEEAVKRLDALAKALTDRPGLKLDIAGRADVDVDREALRHAAVDSAMRREKMRSLAASGAAPASIDEVTIGADERTRWLTAAYRESSLKDRPRNVVGMLKDVPPAEMEAMLLADVTIDDDALRRLANARAQAVKSGLAARNVPDDRLFLLAARLSNERGAAEAAGTAAGSASADASASGAGRSAGPALRVELALR